MSFREFLTENDKNDIKWVTSIFIYNIFSLRNKKILPNHTISLIRTDSH